jgi:hypothetical protein
MKTPFAYHAFISHVFEDKKEIADPLNHALRAAGFNVWYSGSDLRTGDDLDEKILGIIPKCKYAIVIISPDYLKSEWAHKELNAIKALETSGPKIILPIWHDLSQKEIRAALPLLADRFAIFSSHGMDNIIPKLISVLKKRRTSERKAPASSKPNLPEQIAHNGGLNINGKDVQIRSENIAGGNIIIKTATKK